MKFAIFMGPTVPRADKEERRKLRPIARNNEHYQMMLEEVREIAVLADEIGFDALMLSEHHFHSEGTEASVNPLMLLADLAARTKRIMLAPLGAVLPAWTPVRLAEDVAILDHLCQGRLALGIARGYQNRWATTLFQDRHVEPVNYTAEAVEDRNQTVFSEMLKIMKMCWEQETVRYRSDVFEGYSIPFPFDGPNVWPARALAEEAGAPGELDDEGNVRRVCVIPRPYQDPHPEFWQPFAMSERTLRRCGEMNVLPYIFAPQPEAFREKCEAFRQAAVAGGYDYALGQHVGAIQYALVSDDRHCEADLEAVLAGGVIDEFVELYQGFGWLEAFRMEGDPWPVGQFPGHAATAQRMREVGLALVGPPEHVRERILRLYEDGAPFDWYAYALSGIQGHQPLDFVKHQLELFATTVIPALKEVTE